MEPRRPKFVGKKTKWEKRRIVRRFARAAKGKKPLVELLTIASPEERAAALEREKMVFYDGPQRIELPLVSKRGEESLQGIYKVGRDLVVFRHPLTRSASNWMKALKYNIGFGEEYVKDFSFFSTVPDLAHMEVNPLWRGRGLGLKGASKAERHVRATKSGRYISNPGPNLFEIFRKLGFRESPFRMYSGKIGKLGKFNEQDNLLKYHVIEAIDPKTGKARLFRFPIKEASSN
ncbi:MAG: hypothetical protein WC634_05055 [archaeon]